MTGNSTGEGKVSIVIPCYNDGTLLREALASIERVRNENLLEVIVVDDGSFEVETANILSKAQEGGYSVVSQSNRGVGAARNTGIRVAKGEFILPLDSDNRLRDVYLNEAVSLLKHNRTTGVIYTDIEYFGETSCPVHAPEFDLLSLIRTGFIDACALYRKSLWEDVGGYDEQMPWMGLEDWDFWLRVAFHGGTFVHLPKVGFDYRVRKDSISVKTTGFDYRVRRDPWDIIKTSPRIAEVIRYIFSKPEMAFYNMVRETDHEVQALRARIRGIQGSVSYRLGRGLLAPARALRMVWRNFFRGGASGF
jgi:glycosyltransferase involved in cell wall biosynthesis